MKLKNGKVDLSDWNLDAMETFEDALAPINMAILEMSSEALQYCFEHGEISMFMPAEWGEHDGIGNKCPSDPLTLYLSVYSIGDDPTNDNTAHFETSIRDILKTPMEDCAEDGSYSDGLKKIRDGFRDIANDIDIALDASRNE